MVQGMMRGRWAMVAMVAVLAAGCSSDGPGDNGGNFTLTLQQQLAITVDGLNPTANKCSEFLADQTDGAITYRKKVLLRNSGGDGSTLCIKALKFETTNKQLKYVITGGKTKDEAKCKGAEAALAAGKTLTLEVEYKADPAEPDATPASLTIEHNDYKDSKPRSLCFGIADQGPVMCADQKEYTYINPSPANPPTACFYFSNCGSAPLEFKGASFDKLNAHYTITEAPNEGEIIPALGDTGNPATNKKKLKVCVRLTPTTTDKDYEQTLVIQTNDKGNPSSGIKLHAKWEADNKFEVTCSSPTGQMEYNFQGVTVGQKIAKCRIFNHGPSGFLFTKTPFVKAIAAGVGADALAAVYTVHLEKVPEGTVIEGQFSIAKGKSADVVVTFTAPVADAAPQARVEIPFSQANKPSVLLIPILVGSCDTPVPDFGQRPELWLQAGMGGSAKAKVVVANQSCAPMQVLDACVTSAAGVVGAEPCKKGASQYFKLAQPFAATAVDAWGLLPLEVELAPENDIKENVNDLLHVAYCAGTWTNNQCEGGSIVYQSLNLNGSLKTDVKLPEFKLLPVAGAVVGQQLKLEGAFTEGTHPNGNNYAWVIVGRPAGSHVWLPEAYQTTSEPFLTFTPDVAGKYTVAAMAQAIGDGDYSWSPQATLEIEVGPAP